MRKILLSGVILILATAGASAQPWGGWGDGGGYRPPPPRFSDWGDPPPPRFRGPPPFRYGAYGPPVRCWWRDTPWGARRVCREVW